MKTPLRNVLAWASRHKLLTGALAAFFAGAAWFIPDLRGTPQLVAGLMFLACAILTGLLISRAIRKTTITAMLVASLLGVQPQRSAATGEVVVVVVVIIIGGVVVISLKRFCQQHFPPTPKLTNAPPDAIFAPCDAASYQVTPIVYDQCTDGPATPSTGYTLSGTVGAAGFTFDQPASVPAAAAMDAAQYDTALASYGLGAFTDRACYARDGRPISASQSAIHFVADGRTITITPRFSSILRTNIFEESEDMRHWTRTLTVIAIEGTPLRLETDSRRPAKFHRVVRP